MHRLSKIIALRFRTYLLGKKQVSFFTAHPFQKGALPGYPSSVVFY